MEPATMGLIGSLVGSGLQAIGGRAAMDANSAQNSINLAHQNLFRTTAHQVEVEDLKKAGLNPMLSAMGGSGAASAAGSSIGVTNPMEGMASAAKEAAMFTAQIKKLKAETNNINTDTKTKGASAEFNEALRPFIKKVGDWMDNSAKEKESGLDMMMNDMFGDQDAEYKQRKSDVINESWKNRLKNYKSKSDEQIRRNIIKQNEQNYVPFHMRKP